MAIMCFAVNGRQAPYFICDVCGKKIEDAKRAMLKFDDIEQPAILCHKGPCDIESGRLKFWQPLDATFIWLERNSRIERKNAQGKARALSMV